MFLTGPIKVRAKPVRWPWENCETSLKDLLEHHIATYNSVYPDQFLEISPGKYQVDLPLFSEAINNKFMYQHVYFINYQIIQNGVPLTGKTLDDYSYQWTYDGLEEAIIENCGGVKEDSPRNFDDPFL